MPDSTDRPGPLEPPSAARSERPAPRGPYGLPFPRPSVNPPRRNRPDAPRQDILVAQPSDEPAVADEPPRRPVPAAPAPLAPATERPAGIARIALVIALVIGALWADRGRPEPMAEAGVIPQPEPTASVETGQ